MVQRIIAEALQAMVATARYQVPLVVVALSCVLMFYLILSIKKIPWELDENLYLRFEGKIPCSGNSEMFSVAVFRF